ncbi:YeeE/YedE family protein [Salinimonas sp. HHU 13199]|uniref:YeeE/YedE family protein n=1 Tax=Salinimonas profundi TaxID=2729140 RepID=A0ABR8LF29_9ALTE|nr:YeeE/YedE thiosulfate transporter family protein [Salinimonas profundi]MBD3584868.1 YeeE/YedE family protein [Salinimonas profundi]
MQTDLFLQAYLGGMLIGAGALALMLFNGRIAGISGITASAFTTKIQEGGWRWAFLAGLIIAPLITAMAGYTLPDRIPGSLLTLTAAGILVGAGTRLGSGCTSGHGICGLSRLSFRSLIATLLFMGSAIVTVSLVRYVF